MRHSTSQAGLLIRLKAEMRFSPFIANATPCRELGSALLRACCLPLGAEPWEGKQLPT